MAKVNLGIACFCYGWLFNSCFTRANIEMYNINLTIIFAFLDNITLTPDEI